jgi:hypothetical protein
VAVPSASLILGARSGDRRIGFLTATTDNEAEAQSRTSHDFLSAAVTAAAPKSNAVLVIASLFDNREQPISRSDFVFEFWISL